MATLLLLMIYLCFVSLGLYDPFLGAAWPVMRAELGAPLGVAGLVSMFITGGVIIATLLSGRMLRRFHTGRLTAAAALVIAGALLGFSLSPSFIWLIVFAVPLGLGAGTTDAALNNYIALNYEARHMSWLHCFWGVGAFGGSLLAAFFIGDGGRWRDGYTTVSIVQFAVCALLAASFPLWKRNLQLPAGRPASPSPDVSPPINRRRLAMSLLTFLCHSSIESAAGLWSSSFLVEARGYAEASAASAVALYYGSITAGRFLSGFLAGRLQGKTLIRIGVLIVTAGLVLLLLPLPAPFPPLALLLIGLGSAPVFPYMLYLTPARFGADNSQKVIGWQLATAYTGSTLITPLVGLIAGIAGMGMLPLALIVLAALVLFCSERIDRPARAG